jgi:hypothetical protein
VEISAVKDIMAEREFSLKNSGVEVQFRQGIMYQIGKAKTEMYTYVARKPETLSGLYVFNPKKDAQKAELQLEKRLYQKGQLFETVCSFYRLKDVNATIAQEIRVFRSNDTIFEKSVMVVTKISNMDYFEFVMRTDLSDTFDEDSTEIFTDNSVNLQKRQFYTFKEAKKLGLTKSQEYTYIGLNGYASIYGSAFRNDKDHYYSFTNSNSILLNMVKRNIFEIMLMRNTNYYDDKGITEALIDPNIETFTQLLYFPTSASEMYVQSMRLSSILNSKPISFPINSPSISLSMFPPLSLLFNSLTILDIKPSSNKCKLIIHNPHPFPFNLLISPSLVSPSPPSFSVDPSTVPLKSLRSVYSSLDTSIASFTYPDYTRKALIEGYTVAEVEVDYSNAYLEYEREIREYTRAKEEDIGNKEVEERQMRQP